MPTDAGRSVRIRGCRVILRERAVTDIPDDYAWRTNAELSRLDAATPLSMDFEDFEKYSIQELEFPSTRSRSLAVDTIDGLHIGNVMFYDINLRGGKAELGIMIGNKDYWSRGYGTETVDLLLDHMFSEYPFDLVYLHTLEWNYRAQKSFRKSGFRDMHPVRRGGYDFIRMEILRHEWEAMRSKTEDRTT